MFHFCLFQVDEVKMSLKLQGFYLTDISPNGSERTHCLVGYNHQWYRKGQGRLTRTIKHARDTKRRNLNNYNGSGGFILVSLMSPAQG